MVRIRRSGIRCRNSSEQSSDYNAEDDIQQPVLTPSSMLHVNPNTLPELESYHIGDRDLKKRAKFLKRCKLAMWKRWSREYVRSLREQHRQKGQKHSSHPKIGEVVIVLDENQPRIVGNLASSPAL